MQAICGRQGARRGDIARTGAASGGSPRSKSERRRATPGGRRPRRRLARGDRPELGGARAAAGGGRPRAASARGARRAALLERNHRSAQGRRDHAPQPRGRPLHRRPPAGHFQWHRWYFF